MRRNNFTALFMDELVVDKFIATHQYGGGPRELDLEISGDDLT